jgi:tetratricopeptide (TPR) repeat protein
VAGKEFDRVLTSVFERSQCSRCADYLTEAKHRAESGGYADALPYFKAATELSPQTGNYWFELGMALQELSRHGEAATAYERAVVLMPDSFWAHNNLGLACIRAQRPRRAVEVLEKALTLDPKGTTDKGAAKDIARRNLAAAYELNGQPDKAAGLR